MSTSMRYVVFCFEGTSSESFPCDTKEEAENRATDLIKNISVDSVAIYKLQKTGKRHASIQWAEEKPKQQTLQLKLFNGNGEHHYQPWTTDENTYLVGAHKTGQSYQRIAHILGRTERAIEVQASRLRCG